MAASKLENLPVELIARIATFVEARSIIRLSRTSKTIRAACWNRVVFREVIRRSQYLNWRNDSLDLQAIEKRTPNDAATWARYAVADDHAWILAGMQDPLVSRKTSINFLPELAVVRHPILQLEGWHAATHGPFDSLEYHVFSLAMALLSAKEVTQYRFHDPGPCERCFPTASLGDDGFLSGAGSLWILCSMVVKIRASVRTARSVWPYGEDAINPHISIPKAASFPLCPPATASGLPVPFTYSAGQLLNSWSPPPAARNWNGWYRERNFSLVFGPEALLDGQWCGYYTQDPIFGPLTLDPPMRVRFKTYARSDLSIASGCIVEADGCLTSGGKSSVRGVVQWDGNIATLKAVQRYDQGVPLRWNCRITPFGVVGHWKTAEAWNQTNGFMWLWRREWSEDAIEKAV